MNFKMKQFIKRKLIKITSATEKLDSQFSRSPTLYAFIN